MRRKGPATRSGPFLFSFFFFFFLYRKAPLGRTKLIGNFKTFGAYSWLSMNKQSSYNE